MLVDLHNQAITDLLEGREEEGIQRFHQCLSLAKTWCEQGIPASQEEEDEDLETSPYIFEISLVEVIDPEGENGASRTDGCVAMYLYRNLFGVDGVTIRRRDTLLQVISVIAFNIGITFHERGLVSGDTRLLAKARSLYCFSLKIVESDKSKTGELDLAALELALLNNLGHVSAFFLDFEGLERFRGRMKTRLTSLQQQSVDGYEFFKCSCLKSYETPIIGTVAPAA